MFAGYGSDSEEEEVAASHVEVVKKVPPAPAPAAAPVQRKVKRLDISFLPPEIQAALTRGDSTRDSDDDEGESTSKASSRGVARPADAAGDTKSKLLGMLPAPKVREESNDMRPKQSNPANSDSSSATKPKEAAPAPKSKFVFGFSSTETTRKAVTNEKEGSAVTASQVAHTAVAEDNDEDDGIAALPWLQESKQKAVATKERAVPFAMAAAPAKVPSLLTQPSYSSSLHPAGYLPAQGPTEPPTQPAMQQQSYADYLRQQEEAEEDALERDMPAHKRRKGRDIELQLLAGDLSGIQNSAAVQDISTQHQWNEMRYTEQQEREKEVQRGFGIGMNKMLTQVTKQQNRKHQLSSLAMKAAETELAMLDKRGARNLTKSETQGKYGW